MTDKIILRNSFIRFCSANIIPRHHTRKVKVLLFSIAIKFYL